MIYLLSCSNYFKSIGIKVDGFDISESAMTRALEAGIISKVPKDFSGYGNDGMGGGPKRQEWLDEHPLIAESYPTLRAITILRHLQRIRAHNYS